MSGQPPTSSPTSPYPGRVDISPQAIATVVQSTVTACYGIVALVPSRRRPRLLRRRERSEPIPGIVVTTDGTTLTLTLHVIVEHGVRISEVARNVMDTVGYAVEQALGMPVEAVNISVDGLHVAHDES